jgi:hypothetical protein
MDGGPTPVARHWLDSRYRSRVVLVASLVLGREPFIAFISYQLPRMVSGAAFSFSERADIPTFIVSRNFSVYAVVAKPRLLGVAGLGVTIAQAITWIYTAFLLWLAWRTHVERPEKRIQALVWLGLVNLAAMRSPVAPSAYVTGPMLWLLALLAPEVKGSHPRAIALAVAWVLIMGPSPLPDQADLVVGLTGQAIALALAMWVLVRSYETRSTTQLTAATSVARVV